MNTVPTQHQPDSAWTDDNGRPAIWQTAPCPTWCIGGHLDSDAAEDRVHYTYADTSARIPLTLHDPVGPFVVVGPGEEHDRYELAKAWVEADQHVQHANPTIRVGVGDRTAFLNLTVDEADQLRAELAAMVSMLTGGTR